MVTQDRSTRSTAARKGASRRAAEEADQTDGTDETGQTDTDQVAGTDEGVDSSPDPATPEAGESGTDTPSAPETASDDQLAAAPDSTAAQVASGELDPNSGNGSAVDPATVETPGRNPLDPGEQAQTGAPNGADGPVVPGNLSGGGPTDEQVAAARERQHEGLPGTGDKIVFNVSRGPVVVDKVGHVLDAKARRRMESFDEVTRGALRSRDLIDESP